MPESPENYEKVSIYPVDPDVRERLLATQIECVFNWSTRDGWPMGVIMSCMWRDGRMWLTSGAQRHRIAAIRRDARCSVVVTSTGTDVGPGKTVTIKGRCVVHEDDETKAWFYPALAEKVVATPGPAQDAFRKHLDSPLRVVLEVAPQKWLTCDAAKMMGESFAQLGVG